MLVAVDTPAAGTVASATTEYPSAEVVRATLIKAAAINCPLSLGILAARKLTIERIDAAGSALAAGTYAVPSNGDRDRVLEFNIEAAFLPGAAVRARFDACDAGETQWIVINYDYQKV